MKNNNFQNFAMALLVVVFTANSVFAKDLSFVKTLAGKYIPILFAIVFFTVIIYTGLAIYNKFFVPDRLKNYEMQKASLHTPTDKDDAVLKFIRRNKLS